MYPERNSYSSAEKSIAIDVRRARQKESGKRKEKNSWQIKFLKTIRLQ